MTTKKITYQFIQIISLATICIGALTVCGYMINDPRFYIWSGNIPMALNTAIACILQGISTFLLSRRIFYTINNKV